MRLLALLLPALATACATQPLRLEPGRHAAAPSARPADLPAIVERPSFLPPPSPSRKADTYSVVASNLPVRELLFVLARDANLNVDVHPQIEGTVTLNALHQTLPQLLERIARQVAMRYTLEHGVLVISPDTPFIRSYSVDYVNVSRSTQGKVAISTSVAATGGSVGSANGGGAEGRNSSGTEVSNLSENKFWERLEANLRELISASRRTSRALRKERAALNEGVTPTHAAEQQPESERQRQEARLKTAQALAPAGNGAPALLSMVLNEPKPAATEAEQTGVDVFIHPESGVVSVNATASEHVKVRELLERIAQGARRQVLIEATIVEVLLSDQYQAGIDWRIFKPGNGFNLSQNLTANRFADSPLSVLTYTNLASGWLGGADFTATIKALEQFGKTKVLSSPKIMALNNQTALLKVVDEKVYFTTKLEVTAASDNAPERREYTSEIRTVPVGVVMSVTPQIADNAMVSLNVRPTISRITSYKIDPALRLSGSEVDNLIPEIQVRELESTLKLADGQMAVLGGLIQDNLQTSRAGVPLLSRLPLLGDLFSYRDDEATKTELVIFMRPVVVHDPSLNGELREFRQFLPGSNFFSRAADEISVFQNGLSARQEGP